MPGATTELPMRRSLVPLRSPRDRYLHYSLRGIKERGTAPTKGLRMHLLALGLDFGSRSAHAQDRHS